MKTRLAAVTVVAVMLGLAYKFGVFARFADPEGTRETLLALGAWGYLAFVVSYAALQPFGVPGTVFIFAAPLIWSWPVAFVLSMCGTMAASVVGFSFARFVARDFLAARVPARFRKYDEALERRAFATVFVLRLIFWMPPMLHIFFGVSRVPFWTHFWASLAGYVLPLFLVSYFGRPLFDWMWGLPLSVWIGVGVVIVLAGLTYWRLTRRKEQA
jgi:uncharacterized membrane protein YdjX (TVP38/TMEM64 family)